MPNKPIVIGVGGFARSGKDTFVKIAQKILKQNGFNTIKLAFADALKDEIDPFLTTHYNISAWTDNTEEKSIIRPFLVAHGCGKRVQTQGQYWVNKIDGQIELLSQSVDVIFVSDCRFPNEVDWVHNKWSGWFVHVKKYSSIRSKDLFMQPILIKEYDSAPNEEEAKNDPICEQKADYKLELENAIEREKRLTGNIITPESLVDNTYLNEQIRLCLSQFPVFSNVVKR